MKLLYLIVIVLFLHCQYGDCRPAPSAVSNILDIFNTVKDFANRTGKSVTNFINDVSHTIKDAKNKTRLAVNEKLQSMKAKLKTYITEAKESGNKIFDSIASEHNNYTCNDEDPAVQMTSLQLIASHGYHAEAHTVITEDGYILALHRIPFGRKMKESPRKTILLHHGLLGSSADWIISGPEKGLAYILSEAGYDIWLANVRGNTYSRAHISRNTNTQAFWNFTFHEVGQYDLPAIINYIMDYKGRDVKINYVGYSMGTTALFALLSTKTEYNHILRAGFALAPVAHMTDLESPIQLLATFSNSIESVLKLLGAHELLPHNGVQRWLAKHSCKINSLEEALCENSMFILCGFNEKQLNRTLFPLIMGHTPSGASTKTVVHYGQEIRTDGKFKRFDYGVEGNMREYGRPTPPEYPLSNITLPIALLSAESDWLSPDADVKTLHADLANPIEHYVVPDKEFNHLDFMWAKDAPKLVYKKLLQLLESDVKANNVNVNSNII